MPSLRSFRDRIKSVKSTRKITSAMKMVAASKLKKAQEQAQASQPYARAMAEMLARVARNVIISPASSKLLVGTGADQKHLLVVVSACRGLCGGFNANIIKEARRMAAELRGQGKHVSILSVGMKARDALNRDQRGQVIQSYVGMLNTGVVSYADALSVTNYVLEEFESGKFDVCTLVNNEFKSILTQKPRRMQLIPFKMPEASDNMRAEGKENKEENISPSSPYDFEPDEQAILNALLPRNIGVQIYRAMLDSAAGEQASRMTAMDNATRNAGERIRDFTLQYNRARQAYITKELIEIISGAEAL